MIRSLLSYQGSKYKILEELLSVFPTDATHFYDVFGGSATVTINTQYKYRYYNEYDATIAEIIEAIRDCESPENLEMRFDRCVDHFGLGKGNEEEFYEFREHCKRYPHPLKLWVLSKHSFSSLLRFDTSNGEVNIPYGDRGFLPSKARSNKIRTCWEALQGIKVSTQPFEKFVRKILKKKNKGKIVVYLDPPYLASGANVYKGTWTEEDDRLLMSLCDELDKAGIRFVLSNVFRHGRHTNKLLKKWSKKYVVRHVGVEYDLIKPQDMSDQGTEEVIISNFGEPKRKKRKKK